MKIAFLLLALGFGYKIFAEASKNSKKSLKNLGRTVGVFMMVVALLGTLCGGYHMMKAKMSSCGSYGAKSHYSSCPHCVGKSYHGEGKKFCPFSKKVAGES